MPIVSLMTRPLDTGDGVVELAASIRDQGLKFPILVQPDGHVIDGARRVAAMRSLGATEVPVEIKSEYLDICKYLREVREDGYLATGITADRVMWIKTALTPTINTLTASTRGGRGKPKKPQHPVSAAGGTGQVLASALGVSRSYVMELTTLFNIVASPDRRGYDAEKVDRVMAAVRDGSMTPTGAMEALRGRVYKIEFDGTIVRTADQRFLIKDVGASIRGLIRGVAQLGPLSPELDDEELTVFRRELESTRRALTKLINGIVERIDER